MFRFFFFTSYRPNFVSETTVQIVLKFEDDTYMYMHGCEVVQQGFKIQNVLKSWLTGLPPPPKKKKKTKKNSRPIFVPTIYH